MAQNQLPFKTTIARGIPVFARLNKFRKELIAIIAGILTFSLSGFGLSVELGEITINIPWSLSISAMVAMAFGSKYALIAAFSGGALYPFMLWPTNGYLNIADSLLLTALLILIGNSGFHRNPQQNRRFYNRLVGVFLSYISLSSFTYILTGNTILALNPPFWQADAITELPLGTLQFFVMKDAINYLFILCISSIGLSLPAIRKFLGFPSIPVQKDNHKVAFYSMIAVIIIWLLFISLDFILLGVNGWHFKPYFPIALWVLIFCGLIVAMVIMRYSEQRNKAVEILSQAKKGAEESDRLKSAFLANMSHEIRTPMNAIIGFTDLLNSHDLTKNQQTYYLSIIEKSGLHLLSLINDIIEVSRIESGQVKVSAGIVMVKKLMDEVYDTLNVTISKEKNIKLQVCPPPGSANPVLVTDEVKLKQIILNLVGNAIKFTNQGEVKFGWMFLGDDFIFFVEDTGIGIEEKNFPLIFERFRQVEGDNTILAGGSGLGLAISKAYANLLGGTITVKSRLGVGSRFEVLLPRILIPNS